MVLWRGRRVVGGLGRLLSLGLCAPLELDRFLDHFRVIQFEMTHLLGNLATHHLILQVRHQIGDETTLRLRLKITDFFWLTNSRLEGLVMTDLFSGLHAAIVWGADLAGLFLTPGLGLGFATVGALGVGGVAGGLEPSFAHHLRGLALTSLLTVGAIALLGLFVTLLDQRCHAGLKGVVVGLLSEGDLTGLPKVLFTLSLLGRSKLGHVGFVALSDVLVPALLHLQLLHFGNHFGFDDTKRSILLHLGLTEVDGAMRLLLDDLIVALGQDNDGQEANQEQRAAPCLRSKAMIKG